MARIKINDIHEDEVVSREDIKIVSGGVSFISLFGNQAMGEAGKSTPLLYNALVKNENIKAWKLMNF